MNKTVYLSPSMQEGNIGYGDYGTEEQRMNEVADITQRVLKEHGATVYRNRPEWSLSQVVADSNAKNPDIHFAIHSNANTGKARGCEVYCHRLGGEGEKLARAVYEEISLLTPTADRGVKEGYNFYGSSKHMYELAYTNAPAALIEIAFHDNPEDALWIMENMQVIGTALAEGILKYFGIPYKEENNELNKGLEVLEKRGIINSPNYWRENAVIGKVVNGEFAAILIKRVAAYISKGGI